MTELEIQHETDDTRGAFFVPGENGRAALMTYSKAGDTMIIVDHTEVSDALRGRGAGLRLLEALVAWARENSIQVMATCPFAIATFKKHPELADVYVGK